MVLCYTTRLALSELYDCCTVQHSAAQCLFTHSLNQPCHVPAGFGSLTEFVETQRSTAEYAVIEQVVDICNSSHVAPNLCGAQAAEAAEGDSANFQIENDDDEEESGALNLLFQASAALHSAPRAMRSASD